MFNSFDIGRLEHDEIKLRRTDLSTVLNEICTLR